MKKILYSFLVSAFLIACQGSQTYTEHKSQNFSIKVRDDLSETDALNDEAILQFKNEFQELYLIVLEEPKTDVSLYFPEIREENDADERIKLYADILLKNYENSLTLTNFSGYIPVTINGSNAIEMTFNAVDPESKINVFYYVTFIETQNHFFQILTWTLFDSKKEHLDSMEKMIRSFKSRNQNIKLKKATKK
ncbi:hypothetical protein DI487_07700 [Flavobacterium sediminis]|uniref:Lipoprotein n=2 Tax=Flavobacterium TaxID=237 RepID=A0A2U8QVD8_9FLAO|nr:hypothetical protein [Flavobacterium sediminis]AWM13755.1 hypothetical protein DI487_07700 [Flavobacterium sediminis]